MCAKLVGSLGAVSSDETQGGRFYCGGDMGLDFRRLQPGERIEVTE